jgi:hypothetical protein
MTCPHCGQQLSPEEIRALWGAYNGSKTSEAKRRAAAENGKKGGRPRGSEERHHKER